MPKGHLSNPQTHLLATYVHVQTSDQPRHEFYEEDIWLTSSTTARTQTGRVAHHHVGGLSLAFQGRPGNIPRAQQQHRTAAATTAPVDVPVCSGLVRTGSVETEDAEEDEETEWVPPHEYVARRLSRNVESRSVVEGVGRTLKGRDLSRVRDAVWSRTGFFG